MSVVYGDVSVLSSFPGECSHAVSVCERGRYLLLIMVGLRSCGTFLLVFHSSQPSFDLDRSHSVSVWYFDPLRRHEGYVLMMFLYQQSKAVSLGSSSPPPSVETA